MIKGISISIRSLLSSFKCTSTSTRGDFQCFKGNRRNLKLHKTLIIYSNVLFPTSHRLIQYTLYHSEYIFFKEVMPIMQIVGFNIKVWLKRLQKSVSQIKDYSTNYVSPFRNNPTEVCCPQSVWNCCVWWTTDYSSLFISENISMWLSNLIFLYFHFSKIIYIFNQIIPMMMLLNKIISFLSFVFTSYV